jgi:hypothetical protein
MMNSAATVAFGLPTSASLRDGRNQERGEQVSCLFQEELREWPRSRLKTTNRKRNCLLRLET